MANRHLSRSIVLQTLFEWDFTGKEKEELLKVMERNLEEFAPGGLVDKEFMEKILTTVLSKKDDLDMIIGKAAVDWPIDKISVVDRNILRLGLCELLFSDRKEVPAKVAINEAIELAKAFGGETSGKFVNGVLGAVYKEIGEPGKEEETKKKLKNVPFDKMLIVKQAGAVVYSVNEGNLYFAFVHDIFGYWTLSKGSVEEGETPAQAAVREIKEEMGLDIVVKEEIGHNEYVANHPEKGKHRKQVNYFLAESPFVPAKLAEGKGGLDDARWFKASEIIDLNFYNDIVPLVTKSVTILAKQGLIPNKR